MPSIQPHVKLTMASGVPAYATSCRECEGEGRREPLCLKCNGSGEGMVDGSRCLACKGSGVDGPWECEDCQGTGKIPATLLDMILELLVGATQGDLDDACDLLSEALDILHSPCHRDTRDALIEAQERHAKADYAEANAAEPCKRVAEVVA